MVVAGADDAWDTLQRATRMCATCAALEGVLFARFLDGFPELKRPERRPVLFISEAPPSAGGFWTVGPPGAKEDDLREKLLPLLGLGTEGSDRGLSSFVAAGFFLFQSFPRPLKFSAAGVSKDDLNEMLAHAASGPPGAANPSRRPARDRDPRPRRRGGGCSPLPPTPTGPSA